MRLIAIIACLAFFFGSCQNKTRQTDEVKKGIYFSGIFVKEEILNDKQHILYLKNEKDEIVEFISMPFFGENEIKFLKNDGNPNVNIMYDEFYNPVRKKIEKIVRIITPVY